MGNKNGGRLALQNKAKTRKSPYQKWGMSQKKKTSLKRKLPKGDDDLRALGSPLPTQTSFKTVICRPTDE